MCVCVCVCVCVKQTTSNRFSELKMRRHAQRSGQPRLFGTDYPAARLYEIWPGSHPSGGGTPSGRGARCDAALDAQHQPADIVARCRAISPDQTSNSTGSAELAAPLLRRAASSNSVNGQSMPWSRTPIPDCSTDPDLTQTFTNEYVTYAKRNSATEAGFLVGSRRGKADPRG